MRESTWLMCDKAAPMLRHLRGGRGSERKLRLFACACCRRLGERLARVAWRNAVEVAEQYADGLATRQQLAAASMAATPDSRSGSLNREPRLFHVADAARACAFVAAWGAAFVASQSARNAGRKNAEQVALMRDIFGNPFRVTGVTDTWQSPTALTLGRAAYEERDLPSEALDAARLAVLADALEEAGCASAEILDHLRSPGPHIRGCWAMDLILDKK